MTWTRWRAVAGAVAVASLVAPASVAGAQDGGGDETDCGVLGSVLDLLGLCAQGGAPQPGTTTTSPGPGTSPSTTRSPTTTTTTRPAQTTTTRPAPTDPPATKAPQPTTSSSTAPNTGGGNTGGGGDNTGGGGNNTGGGSNNSGGGSDNTGGGSDNSSGGNNTGGGGDNTDGGGNTGSGTDEPPDGSDTPSGGSGDDTAPSSDGGGVSGENNPDLPDEVDVNGPTGNRGNAASDYDGVYAEGVPIGVAMATTRWLESRNDYRAQSSGSSASGAYQVIDSTWNNYQGYPRAVDAPARVQDQFAFEGFVAILKRYGNDVSKIPLAWYYPRAIGNDRLMDIVPVPSANNVLTPREYQAMWMQKFYELLGEGAPPFLPDNDPNDPYIRQIAFPVLGPTWFTNDWGDPRDGGARRHEGNDLMGESGQPLRSAVDGTITRLRWENQGTAGAVISITDADGYRYNYFHVNDDTPNTVDGAADAALRIHPNVQVGTTIKAGQVIGYMGDSGNSPGVPHLHFEIRDPAGNPFNPYPSLLAAQQREQCSVGIGPWSTIYPTTDEDTTDTTDDGDAGSGDDVSELIIPPATMPANAQRHTIDGRTNSTWMISTPGIVHAQGTGALIAPPSGEACPVIPKGRYGTNAKGTPIELLPTDWWDNIELPDIDMNVPNRAARGQDELQGQI